MFYYSFKFTIISGLLLAISLLVMQMDGTTTPELVLYPTLMMYFDPNPLGNPHKEGEWPKENAPVLELKNMLNLLELTDNEFKTQPKSHILNSSDGAYISGVTLSEALTKMGAIVKENFQFSVTLFVHLPPELYARLEQLQKKKIGIWTVEKDQSAYIQGQSQVSYSDFQISLLEN